MTKNRMTFEQQIKRIEKAHSGGKFNLRRRVKEGRKPLRFPMHQFVLIFGLSYCALTGAKIYLEREMGAQEFTSHLASLASGGKSARVAAKLLQRDRFMSFVGERI